MSRIEAKLKMSDNLDERMMVLRAMTAAYWAGELDKRMNLNQRYQLVTAEGNKLRLILHRT